MLATANVEKSLHCLDVALFEAVPSQTTAADRRSLLALQRMTRQMHSPYTYLEIGSHLGGTIYPHLVDPLCQRIYSIDKRPLQQADERPGDYAYPDNSTERMLSVLREASGSEVDKITCFDSDAREIDPQSIQAPPQLCFIDGEHTKEAVVSDFDFCLRVSSPDAVICFHDADIVCRGIAAIKKRLRKENRSFTSVKLGGSVYAIILGDAAAKRLSAVQDLAKNETAWLLLSHGASIYRRYFKEAGKPALRMLLSPIVRYLHR